MADRKNPDLKLLNGNPGKRETHSSTKSQTGIPSPPSNLRGEAFAEWCRVTDFLSKIGKIEQIDYAALTVYCVSWATYVDAVEAMEHGILIPGRDGALVKNPAAQVMRDASDTMLKYGSKFGFTPKDRQNLGIGQTAGETDELGEFLAG
ncbi:phage terminase small subunit P27 family [Actinoplanes sp. CA-054009]